MTPARGAGSTTHISVILDVVDRSGFPGYRPKRLASCCLLIGGVGTASLGRLARLCRAPGLRSAPLGRTTRVKERSQDIAAGARASDQLAAEKAGEE